MQEPVFADTAGLVDPADRFAAEVPAWSRLSPAARVREGLERFGPRTAIACSYSPEDVALIALAVDTGLPFRVVVLDTGRLPEETHWASEQVRSALGVNAEWWLPDPSEVRRLLDAQGSYGFRSSLEARQACCHVRKVLPLRRALASAPAWLTGMRRAHGVTRSGIAPIAWDEASGGLAKLNPLFDWRDEALEAFTAERGLPRHLLTAQGYPSIGCAPCTRAVAAGQPARAGRWWWEDPTSAECGLHPIPRRTAPIDPGRSERPT